MVNAYDEIIKNGQDNPYKGRARLSKGLCLAIGGDQAGAQKELEGVIQDNPEDVFITLHARFELAHIFENQKDYDQAVKLYMMVALLYKDPEYSPKALIQAGAVFQDLNNPKEALNVYQQVLSDYPQSPLASEARKFIETIQ